MSEPICTVMVGLPAMGKSTLIEGMYKPDTWIYSTDNYIEQKAKYLNITYNEAFGDNIQSAIEHNEVNLRTSMSLGKDVIWDQTNLGEKKRRKIVNRMKQAGYQVRCECIVPPEPGHFDDLKEWKRRLENRPGKNIPQHVLSNMMENYVEPTIEEGFDMITFYNMHGALIAINYGEDK